MDFVEVIKVIDCKNKTYDYDYLLTNLLLIVSFK